MPVYDYLCAKCGPFTDMRPMVESDLPLGMRKKGAAGFSDCTIFRDDVTRSWVHGRSQRAECGVFQFAAVA
jgi:hypothetical protein